MPPTDILALIGKSKPSLSKGGEGPPVGKGASDMMSSGGGGAEEDLAREAFSALKDDDVEGFVSAFTSAVKACVAKAKDDEYETEPDTAEV